MKYLLTDLRHKLNSAVVGKSMSDVAPQLEGILAAFGRNERTSTALIISNLIEMAIEKPEEKVVLAGTANLARNSAESSAEIHGILASARRTSCLATSTERRRRHDESQELVPSKKESGLKRTSLVTMGYAIEGNPLGGLGIIGPTRMDDLIFDVCG
jgi:heat-inducible transcriptional repressor